MVRFSLAFARPVSAEVTDARAEARSLDDVSLAVLRPALAPNLVRGGVHRLEPFPDRASAQPSAPVRRQMKHIIRRVGPDEPTAPACPVFSFDDVEAGPARENQRFPDVGPHDNVVATERQRRLDLAPLNPGAPAADRAPAG